MKPMAIGCGRILGAPSWWPYAMDGHSVPVARLLAARDAVADRLRRWRR